VFWLWPPRLPLAGVFGDVFFYMEQIGACFARNNDSRLHHEFGWLCLARTTTQSLSFDIGADLIERVKLAARQFGPRLFDAQRERLLVPFKVGFERSLLSRIVP
jgi:hypothetical protein